VCCVVIFFNVTCKKYFDLIRLSSGKYLLNFVTQLKKIQQRLEILLTVLLFLVHCSETWLILVPVIVETCKKIKKKANATMTRTSSNQDPQQCIKN
jgi:hypothetical protein